MNGQPDASPLLAVEGLQTHFTTRAGIVRAVDGVSFSIAPGGVLGLVGESGSGKSMTAYSIMRLVDAPGRIVAGRILFKGHDLLTLGAEPMRRLRGDRIAMIFQDPMMTLNPVLRIDTQMTEAIHAHRSVSREQALEEARAALDRVGIPSPAQRLRSYPHQFSGGMRQRVAIAIAMLNKPDLIICDEPTTALDVTTQAQILGEMQALCHESGAALLWITHDLAVVAGLADHLCVMRNGRIVESGTTESVLLDPQHAYTRQLLDATPSRHRPGERLSAQPALGEGGNG
ncbi:MAG: methionine transporter ATP-binding protein [Paucimonas sp.]|nr:methionine transporter ATP-binding protein [Paucimonas sp.]